MTKYRIIEKLDIHGNKEYKVQDRNFIFFWYTFHSSFDTIEDADAFIKRMKHIRNPNYKVIKEYK